MTLHHLFLALCIVWPLSEFWIGARHRSGKRNEVRDQGTLRLLVALALAIALMVLDHRGGLLTAIRGQIEVAVQPLWR